MSRRPEKQKKQNAWAADDARREILPVLSAVKVEPITKALLDELALMGWPVEVLKAVRHERYAYYSRFKNEIQVKDRLGHLLFTLNVS